MEVDWQSIPGNVHAFGKLCDLVRGGEAVSFVGAGASAGLYPLWGALIESLADEAVYRGLANAVTRATWLQFSESIPDQAVRGIKAALGAGTYAEILHTIFKPRSGVDGNNYTPLHGLLLRLPLRGHITTNFDPGILEARKKLRPDCSATGFATWQDANAIERWNNGDIFKDQICPILFAHGIYDRHDTLILDTEGYRRAYCEGGALRRLLLNFWEQARLLIVGFSFSDDWVRFVAGNVLSPGRRGAPRHVALIGLPEDKEYTSVLRDFYLDQYQAEPLFYRIGKEPDGSPSHTDLVTILEKLRVELDIQVPGASGAPYFIPTAIDRSTYLFQAQRFYDVLDLSVLARPGAVGPDDPRPRLSQVFIPLNARRSRPPQPLPRDWLKEQGFTPDQEEVSQDKRLDHWMNAKTVPLLTALTEPDGRAAVLLGDAGAGKSSVARRLLLALLGGNEEADASLVWYGRLSGHLPILVELRDYDVLERDGKVSDLVDYVGYIGEHRGFGFTRHQLNWTLAHTPTLLIFDGLDEIPDPIRRKRTSRAIFGIAANLKQSRILVTARIAGFDESEFEANDFTIFTLDDLDDSQILAFCDVWFDLVFVGIEHQAGRARADLLEALQSRPNLRALAGNPLLLTIMAIIARHGPLARSRTGLYDQALEVLTYAWDLRKEITVPTDSPLHDLTPADKLDLIRRVAWRMQQSADGLRTNAIDERSLRSAMEDYFREVWDLPTAKCRSATTQMIELLQQRNWILTLRGPALYGFVHRTFLEYLCASELRRMFQDHEIGFEQLCHEHIIKHVDNDAWREIILLFVGFIPSRQATDLVSFLLPDRNRALGEINRLAVSFQCLAECDRHTLHRFSELGDAMLSSLYFLMECVGGIPPSSYSCVQRIADALKDIGPTWPNGQQFLAKRGLPNVASAVWSTVFTGIVGLGRHDPTLHNRLLDLLQDNPVRLNRFVALSSLAAHYPEDSNLEAGPGYYGLGDSELRRWAEQALSIYPLNDRGVLALLYGKRRDPALLAIELSQDEIDGSG